MSPNKPNGGVNGDEQERIRRLASAVDGQASRVLEFPEDHDSESMELASSAEALAADVSELLDASSGKCRDCAHWGGYGSVGEEPYPGWEACALAESASGAKLLAHSLMVAADAESYAADLFTSPDFGCVQFMGRPEGAA